MGRGGPGRYGQHVLQIAVSRAAVHGPRERHHQKEHGVEEHRDREDVPTRRQSRSAPVLAQQAQERPHDPVGRPAVHHRLPDDGGHGDHDADGAGRAAQRLGHAHHLVLGGAGGEQADHQRRGHQSEERVHPEHEDATDHGGHPDQQNQQWRHGVGGGSGEVGWREKVRPERAAGNTLRSRRSRP
jgi:hypothetical protein